MMEDVGSYIRKGVNLAFGTDTEPQNMAEEVRMASTMGRAAAKSVRGVWLSELFHAATIGGARALGLPHSVNLNCMATPDGQLFLSCSGCERKFWGRHVKDNDTGRLRLNGRVYPVVFNRVTDPAVLDRAWAARVKKLQVHGGGPYNPVPPPDAKRPKEWGTFQLRSAI